MTRPRVATATDPWAKEALGYDDRGPGFVGWYADNRSHVASQAISRSMRVAVRGTPIDDPAHPLAALITEMVRAYRNPTEDAIALFRTHARHRSIVGEAILGSVAGYGEVVALPVDKVVKVQNNQPMINVAGKGWVPLSRFHRSYTPDAQDPDKATCALKRALPEVRRYVTAVHGQVRPVDNRIVMNGLLQFKTQTSTGARAQLDTIVDDYVDAASRAGGERREYLAPVRDGRESIAYPIEADEPPNWIDIGRDLDPAVLVMEVRALEAFARASGMPIKLMVEGPGSAKFANEDVITRAYLTEDIQPLVDDVLESWAQYFLRPRLAMIARSYQGRPGRFAAEYASIRPEEIEIWADAMSLMVPADLVELKVDAAKVGIVSRHDAAQSLGVEAPELPDGMTEAQWLAAVLSNGRSLYEGTQAAEPSPVGSTVVNVAAPAPMMIERPQPFAVGTPTPAAIAPAPVEHVPAVPPVRVAPTPKVAAPRTDVLATLTDLDQALWGSLAGWVDDETERLLTEVAKASIRALPRGSEERKAAADASTLEALEIAADAGVDVPTIAAAITLADVRTTGARRAVNTAGRMVRATVPGTPEPETTRAVEVLGSAVLLWLGAQAANPRRQYATPYTAVTESMMAAAGAQTIAGRLLRVDGVVIDDAGRRWNAGSGYAIGAAPLEAARPILNGELRFEWRHAYRRTPKDPYLDHLRLHGEDRASTDPALWGGNAVDDHHNCTCATIPFVVGR